jgi:hypothetical protein
VRPRSAYSNSASGRSQDRCARSPTICCPLESSSASTFSHCSCSPYRSPSQRSPRIGRSMSSRCRRSCDDTVPLQEDSHPVVCVCWDDDSRSAHIGGPEANVPTASSSGSTVGLQSVPAGRAATMRLL